MTQLIAHAGPTRCLTLVYKSKELFSLGLIQSHIFTEGTYENMMRVREHEFSDLKAKIIKKRLTDSFRKELVAYSDVLQDMTRLTLAIRDLGWKDPMINNVTIATLTDTSSKAFIVAHQEAIKNFHDVAEILLLQKNITKKQLAVINSMHRLLTRYDSYINDISNADNFRQLVKEIDALETLQTKDYRKELTGKILKVSGIGLMIFATVITINPAVSLTLMLISLGLTIVGAIMNSYGIGLNTPRESKEQLHQLNHTFSFFKNAQPFNQSISAKVDKNPPLLAPVMG